VSLQEVKIVMTGPGRGEVFLDGQKVDSVVSLNFNASVGCVNQLHLILNVGNGDITSMADVRRTYSLSWWRLLLRKLRERRVLSHG
jgi:hypothetical protein